MTKTMKKLQQREDGRKAFLAIDGPKAGEFIWSYGHVYEYSQDSPHNDRQYYCPILKDRVVEFDRHQYICDLSTGEAKYNTEYKNTDDGKLS